MLESRKVYSVKLGDGSEAYRVVLKSVACEESGAQSRDIKYELLKQVIQNFDLLSTAGVEFVELNLKYKDGHWQIETKVFSKKN